MHEITKDHIEFCEKRGIDSTLYCERCGKKLDPEKAVWIEMNNKTARFVKKAIPEEEKTD